MLNYTLIKLEARSLQTLTTTRMATIQNWHIVLLCHLINSCEQTHKVLLCIDILLTMGTQQDIFALFQSKLRMNIAGLNLCQILMQHLSHRATSHISTLLRQSTICQIAAGMLTISHIHIADDIHDATVCLLWQTLILTSVTSLHVEDGDVQTLSTNHAQARIGIA